MRNEAKGRYEVKKKWPKSLHKKWTSRVGEEEKYFLEIF